MKYPIGIQNFEKIRHDGFAYVDKTAQMYKMVSEGSYYFLSRPRRFGKSLMVSTLEAFFSGKKELFDGLYVGTVDWEWKEYPILHLDLNSREYKDESSLAAELNRLQKDFDGYHFCIPCKGMYNSFSLLNTLKNKVFQSGYLTLKSYDAEFDSYTLGFPNREVEQGFIKYLLPLTRASCSKSASISRQIPG